MTQRPIDYRHNPNNFKTTYSQSYTDVQTFYASPLYEELHKRQRYREPSPYNETENIIRRDTELRELERRKLAEYYRREAELEQARQENESRLRQELPDRNQQRYESPANRNRSRDVSPQRYSYEPLSHRSRYQEEYGQRNDFQQGQMSYRNGDADERLSPRRERITEFLHPNLQPDTLNDDYDGERHPRFCNRCFKSNVCINKFKCPHQYCDDCMTKLKGTENPFRGSWLWQYKCGICPNDEWCSENRLTRYDAKGRRIERFKDVRYIES